MRLFDLKKTAQELAIELHKVTQTKENWLAKTSKFKKKDWEGKIKELRKTLSEEKRKSQFLIPASYAKIQSFMWPCVLPFVIGLAPNCKYNLAHIVEQIKLSISYLYVSKEWKHVIQTYCRSNFFVWWDSLPQNTYCLSPEIRHKNSLWIDICTMFVSWRSKFRFEYAYKTTIWQQFYLSRTELELLRDFRKLTQTRHYDAETKEIIHRRMTFVYETNRVVELVILKKLAGEAVIPLDYAKKNDEDNCKRKLNQTEGKNNQSRTSTYKRFRKNS